MTYKKFAVLLLLIISIAVFVLLGKKSLMEPKFNYYVSIGSFEDFPVVFDLEHSYLFDNQQNTFLNFGGLMAIQGDEWGGGTQASSMLDEYPVPSGMNVRWFSVVENQFWEARVFLPKEQMKALFSKGFDHIAYQSQGGYSRVIVNAASKGRVVVWLGGEGQSIQILEAQAKPVEAAWAAFEQGSIGYESSREEFIKSFADDVFEGGHKIKKQLGLLMFNGDRWRILQAKYDWHVSLSTNYKPVYYYIAYMNGEKYYTVPNPHQSGLSSSKQAMPSQLFLTLENKQGQAYRLQLVFAPEETASAFIKLAAEGAGHIVLQLDIDDALGQVEVTLRNEHTPIVLNKVTVAKVDLYDK